MPDVYEFFAGGGMARAGLGSGWRVRFANDIDPAKAQAYRANWGEDGTFRLGDIAALEPGDLPGHADLAWGSFPCQDLSLAGAGAGFGGARSGTFHAVFDLIDALAKEARAPRLVAVENVCGAITSRGGRDFEAICARFAAAGYRFGALVIDAELFTPQSRPRLFVVGVRASAPLPHGLAATTPCLPFHTTALVRALEGLPPELRRSHLWWRLPPPPPRTTRLIDLIEANPDGVAWHAPEQTARLLALMSPLHRAKVKAAARSAERIGCVYRRTRSDRAGRRTQRAEVRFDAVAGCLRTPGGGSSRQTLLAVEGEQVRSRLISPREAARLMGLPDSYALPARYNAAYRLLGDGVVVDVVRHLARHLLEPLLGMGEAQEAA